MTTLTAMPDAFAAGTTVTYTRSLPDYPANDGWNMKLHIAGAAVLHLDAGESGAYYVVTISATNSALLTPAGVYRWSEEVTKTGVGTFTVASGTVRVSANMATAAAGDLQTFEEKALATVEAALLASVGSDMVSYQIQGRGVTRESRADALAFRNRLAWAVAKQRGGGKSGRVRRVTFTGTEAES